MPRSLSAPLLSITYIHYIQQSLTSIMSLIVNFKNYFIRLYKNFTTTQPPMDTPEPEALPDSTTHSQFRYDNDSSATLTLPDGRKLGYAQYGDLTGRPILYQHGIPGSRVEAARFHDLGL